MLRLSLSEIRWFIWRSECLRMREMNSIGCSSSELCGKLDDWLSRSFDTNTLPMLPADIGEGMVMHRARLLFIDLLHSLEISLSVKHLTCMYLACYVQYLLSLVLLDHFPISTYQCIVEVVAARPESNVSRKLNDHIHGVLQLFHKFHFFQPSPRPAKVRMAHHPVSASWCILKHCA